MKLFAYSKTGDDLEVEDIDPEQRNAPCWRYQMTSSMMKTDDIVWR